MRRFVLIVLLTGILAPTAARAEDGDDLWLRYAPIENISLRDAYRLRIAGVIVQQSPASAAMVSQELARGLAALLGVPVPSRATVDRDGVLIVGTIAAPVIATLGWRDELTRLGPEGFVIRDARINGHRALVVASAGDSGAVYGAFHLLRLLSTATPIDRLDIRERPRHQLRLLNHWDNLNGSIERGYAGRSLWRWDELPSRVDRRLRDYARASASLGLNGAVLNNVNADPRVLTAEYIAKVTAIADTLRPYGLKVYLSANFAAPRLIGGLTSTDPRDRDVQRWWKEKADEIYTAISDFGGFLVKADSEGQPGPQAYRRTHAEGANLLADAVAPHGGIVIWRAFVYDAGVDPDRVKRAYLEFVPLDGTFRDNVLVQTKNGPLDFMPREPYHPLFGALPKTPNMVELQITQEYLGHSTHLVYLAPMWKEFFDTDTFVQGPGSTVARVADGSLQGQRRTGIAGVANTGGDRNWTGHPFAAANWYAFGRLAWNSSITAEAIADEWIVQTWSRRPEAVKAIATLMLGSREAYVNYTMPLGLHHLIGGDHYGVMPENDDKRRADWSALYYHRADDQGIGFDRTRRGSAAVDQYAKVNADRWNDPETTPEKLLLWFHHLPWNYRLKSGQTLWQALVEHYDRGAEQAARMERGWAALKGAVDDQRHAVVAGKLQQQALDAAAWRDTCLAYFAQFSRRPVSPPR
jgi:alpha-glucuronidase